MSNRDLPVDAEDRITDVSAAAAYTLTVSEPGHHPPLFVVGIGASAGGLEALVELLGAVPATGMAFIVVQHLDPKHESLLPEILTKKTTMAVSLATPGEAGAARPCVRHPSGCALDGARGPPRAEAADECSRTAVPGGSPLLVARGGVWRRRDRHRAFRCRRGRLPRAPRDQTRGRFHLRAAA